MPTAAAASAPPIPALPRTHLPGETWDARLLTRFGAGLDAAILAGMQLVVDALLSPAPGDVPALRASADALLTPELVANPERFFDFSEQSHEVRELEAVRSPARRRRTLTRKLATRYQSWQSEASDGPPDPIRLEHWQHPPERRRGTALLLHGFTMGSPRIDAPILFASSFFSAGFDVALLTLPQHGARTPADARFSGERFAVPEVAGMAEGVRRALHDVRSTTLWLRETTGAPVGLVGLSLGGYLTALSAGLYDDLDFAIPIVPPVCMGDLAHGFYARSRSRGRGEAPTFSYDELRRGYRIHSPLAHALRLPRERVMIVAGRGDRIVPPEHPHALWLHWGRPRIHWYSGGHLTALGRSGIGRSLIDHLHRLDLC